MVVVTSGILALLAISAIMVARLRDLWAAIMVSGIFSFLGACWMMLLDAPDVSFTEAAVGAGISTVLMLSTLAIVGNKEIAAKPRPIALITVTLTGMVLVYGTLDMPAFGDAEAPIHKYPSPGYVEKSMHDMHGLPNVVTSVLASYRGFDTLGETMVVFTAGLGVVMILLRDRKANAGAIAPVDRVQVDRVEVDHVHGDDTPSASSQGGDGQGLREYLVIRVISKLLIPFIILFGLYVQFHGDYGPGGGFQAGVIISSAFILYGLVFGLKATKKVAPKRVVEKLLAIGLMIYAGTGFLTMFLGGKFLDYEVLEHNWFIEQHVPSGQHLGIFMVELGVGLAVASVMITIFYAFTERSEVE